jgi:hypothetical protein
VVKPRSDTSIDTTSLLLEELERKANEDDGDEDEDEDGIVNADASSGEAAAKMAMDLAFIVIN